jgi:hypothetical protein
MSALPVPAAPDAITTAWLTEVLRNSGTIGSSSEVASFAAEQVGAGVGVMGVLVRTTLTYSGTPSAGAPASVIVKLPSPYEENRAQGVGLGMYEAEVRFLNELAGRTPVRVPKVYHASIVSGTAEFAIVMEDLGHLDMGDQIAGLSVPRATAAARAMADVHAAWWGRVRTDELEWIPSVVHPRIQGLGAMWPDIWAGFTAKFGYVLPTGAHEVGEQVKVRYWGLMQALGAMDWTLIHQDFRVDNLFFDALDSDEPVVVIDWQGLGRGPAIYDLAYFLGGSLTVEDRRAAEHDIVGAYHERLVAGGVSGYSFDQLWHGYRMGMLSGLSTAVLVGATFDLANERGTKLVEVLGSRHFAAAVDVDALTLLP